MAIDPEHLLSHLLLAKVYIGQGYHRQAPSSTSPPTATLNFTPHPHPRPSPSPRSSSAKPPYQALRALDEATRIQPHHWQSHLMRLFVLGRHTARAEARRWARCGFSIYRWI